jgi:hypothetical protein
MTTGLKQIDRIPPRPGTIAGAEREELRRGMIRTQVSRSIAWIMIALFLAIIFGLPIHQAVIEWSHGRRPGVLDIFTNGRFPRRADLKQYEDGLEEQSLAIRFCQPRLQQLLTRWGRTGSASVVAGLGGWLFYRPGLDSVISAGFLDAQTLRRRTRNWRDAAVTQVISPDPRPAILQFKQQVESAGAKLVLLPIPDKASIQGFQLASHAAASVPAVNPSFGQFVAELRAAGVEVFDPTPAIIHSGEVRYLAQDTHWTPQWMDEVARQLAERLRPHLGPAGLQSLHREAATISGVGDLVEMLRLPERQNLFSPQSVTMERVLDAAGGRLRPDQASPVLLLGDSFTNIYSATPMGWGDGAGLAEHLSFHLRQPIDWIARNDAGAHATRELLASQLTQGRNRLAGKKVVIWQFAARELSLGDWRPISLPVPAKGNTNASR